MYHLEKVVCTFRKLIKINVHGFKYCNKNKLILFKKKPCTAGLG